MFEELKGKEVLIQMGSTGVVTDRHKGTVVKIGESWLKIQTKKKMVYINWAWSGVSLRIYKYSIPKFLKYKPQKNSNLNLPGFEHFDFPGAPPKSGSLLATKWD